MDADLNQDLAAHWGPKADAPMLDLVLGCLSMSALLDNRQESQSIAYRLVPMLATWHLAFGAI